MAQNGRFNRIGISSPKNSAIDLSHTIMTSFDFMHLKPILVEEMLPSDTFNVDLSSYVRVAPLPQPVYGDIKVTTCSFFVPNRIIWDGWKDFITGGSNGRITKNVPSINIGQLGKWIDNHAPSYKHRVRNWLSDFGLPSQVLSTTDAFNGQLISTLPFRAVRRAWFDWLRDANLIGEDAEKSYCFRDDASHFSLTSIDASNVLEPMNCPFEKDYFTTAFLEPQRGMDSFAPVEIASSDFNPNMVGAGNANTGISGFGNLQGDLKKVGTSVSGLTADNNIIGQLKYNDLRLAHAIQHYLERNNIAGANSIQQLLAHWGTAPNPAVYNMSEYINSSDSFLNCDEVTSLSDTDSAALGDTTTKFNGVIKHSCRYTANEHGYLVVLQMCRPITGYYQGLDRKWQRFDKFDYFTPEMECTGFQPLYAKELFSTASDSSLEDSVFGYVPRFSEYKFHKNTVTSDFAMHGSTSGDMYGYHLNRDLSTMFGSNPSRIIDTAFTGSRLPVLTNGSNFDRIFNDTNTDFDHFLQICRVSMKTSRPMRGFTIPVIDEIAGHDTTIPYAGVRL